MANPVIVPCLKDVWTKVATNVLSGTVKILSLKPTQYYETYRLTGDAAPAIAPGAAGDEAFPFESMLGISDSVGIDVYVFSLDEIGSVRVDV